MRRTSGRSPCARAGRRRRLHRVAVGVLAGIPAQAVLGGITVLTGLNPWTVMSHFLVSMVPVSYTHLTLPTTERV